TASPARTLGTIQRGTIRLEILIPNSCFLVFPLGSRISAQIAFAPMAICFQFVPSLIARQGTLPVPPVLRYTSAPTFFAAVRPAAVSEATFVKPRILRFSCSPLRSFSKPRGISLPIALFEEQACYPAGQHAHRLIVVSDCNQAN